MSVPDTVRHHSDKVVFEEYTEPAFNYRMTNITTKLESQPGAETAIHLFDNWFDPIETGLRDRVREFIHAMIEGELDLALSRPRYARHTKLPSGEAEGVVGAGGHRHGHRSRSLLGSFGQVEIEVRAPG